MSKIISNAIEPHNFITDYLEAPQYLESVFESITPTLKGCDSLVSNLAPL